MFGKITAVKHGSNQAITDTSSLAFLNPLRYRGYVYDDETGLYYLRIQNQTLNRKEDNKWEEKKIFYNIRI